MSRRALSIAVVFILVPCLAWADQPYMGAAFAQLEQAPDSVVHAAFGKGSHRAKALRAVAEVDASIQFDRALETPRENMVR